MKTITNQQEFIAFIVTIISKMKVMVILKSLSIEGYLKIKPCLTDIIIDLQKFYTWKIQLRIITVQKFQ